VNHPAQTIATPRRGATAPGHDDDRHALARALRHAVAAEYAAKLPASMPLAEFARFAGITLGQLRRAVSRGDLVVSISGGRRRIAPADNLDYLRRSRLLHLPRPFSARNAEPKAPAEETRRIDVSAETFELLWERAVIADSTPAAVIAGLVRA
jgi:hypothetical protein